MNHFFVFALFLANLFAVTSFAQPGFGHAERINDEWQFRLGDQADWKGQEVDRQGWQVVRLPHDWSVKGQLSPHLASATGYLPGGIGWYRKHLRLPEATEPGSKLYLYFEGVYNRSEVFVNGQSLGDRPNGYISFLYDATPYLKPGADNVIAVRVDHSRSADSRWYTGSGIYRDVWLVTAPAVHLDLWGVYAYPEVTKRQGLLHVETQVVNHGDDRVPIVVEHELEAPGGKIVARKNTRLNVAGEQQAPAKVTLAVNDPQLWSLERPTLYRLRTKVLQAGKVIDESVIHTGFRTFTFDANQGFALNGEWMKVKGVCIHHDAGVLGAEVYPEVWRRRLTTLKQLGVNAIRTSHNPQATSLYSLCDELGLLVINEAYDEWEYPKRKWLEGWNVGTPGFEGSYDFFEAWGERDLADMVRRDRNHLSIFAWSIGNEVDYPNDPYSHPVLDGSREGGFTQPIFGGYKKDAPDAMRLGGIAQRLAAVVREHDRSRPVTAGLAGVAMSNETAYPDALDIAGYNYTESRYHQDHEAYPNRVIYGSENRHDYDAWKAVRDNQHIFGQFLWTGIDYLGESGRWPSRGFYSGLLDFGGFVKPRGRFRQALWSESPVLYVGTYPAPGQRARRAQGAGGSVLDETEPSPRPVERPPSIDAWPDWNYEADQLIRVVCYTNAANARLELNGTVVGERKPRSDNHGVIYWDIPYASGTLEAVGMDSQGKEESRYAIQTTGRGHAITAKVLDEGLLAAGGVAQILVQVVDDAGRPVSLSDEEITCHIDGPGRLLGLEAGNNADMTDYTDHVHRVYRGQLIAYIQANGNSDGTINVRFTAPWLQAAAVTLSATGTVNTGKD